MEILSLPRDWPRRADPGIICQSIGGMPHLHLTERNCHLKVIYDPISDDFRIEYMGQNNLGVLQPVVIDSISRKDIAGLFGLEEGRGLQTRFPFCCRSSAEAAGTFRRVGRLVTIQPSWTDMPPLQARLYLAFEVRRAAKQFLRLVDTYLGETPRRLL